MRLLRHEQQIPVAWKNGGGVTREIAIGHDPSGRADFLWRASIATVRQAGPFSRFEGVDRTIAVLSGNGISLRYVDGETVALTTASPPFRFDGATPIFSDVIAGETMDLNAMSQRGRASHAMRRMTVAEPTRLTCTADHTILVAAGPLALETQGETHALLPLDAAIDLAPGTNIGLDATVADAYILEFST